jgi:hypothetical protein
VERIALGPEPDLVLAKAVEGPDEETLEDLLRARPDPKLPPRRQLERARARFRGHRLGLAPAAARRAPERLQGVKRRQPPDSLGKRDLEDLEAVAVPHLHDEPLAERLVDDAVADAKAAEEAGARTAPPVAP